MGGFCAKLNGKIVRVSDCFPNKGERLTDMNGTSIAIVRNVERAAASRRVPLLLSPRQDFFGLR